MLASYLTFFAFFAMFLGVEVMADCQDLMQEQTKLVVTSCMWILAEWPKV
jgi:hypothetical protein